MIYKRMRFLLVFTLGLILPLKTLAADSFNILLYHHISSTMPRSTSLTAQEFEGHLAYLKSLLHRDLHLESLVVPCRIFR